MRRLDIKVGYSCNNLCHHCVQGEKRYKMKDKSTAEIKSELKEAFSRDIKAVVFTGGEPTIRKDLISNVAFAKELGYELIQVQTNGRMFASKKFTNSIVEAGMTEFSPALNGHIPELHDYLSQVPGAWKQTVAGIKNVREYPDIRIMTNTVMVKPNYRVAKHIAELLVKLGVNQYQLAFVHPAGRAWTDFDSLVPFISMAAPYIHLGLQVGIDAGITTMAEAIPFCHMKDYEKQVSELCIPPADVYESGFKTREWEKWRKTEGKWKGESCKPCKFYQVCEGPWKEYVERRGSSEFTPVPGKPVTESELLE
ncbi:MAG: radical SAM protein [Candidatus Altiarchaeota archaeon]|nr:radical SAM protein [Candidatus Altiarchaeota archaeon]